MKNTTPLSDHILKKKMAHVIDLKQSVDFQHYNEYLINNTVLLRICEASSTDTNSLLNSITFAILI